MAICWFCEKKDGDRIFEVKAVSSRLTESTTFQKKYDVMSIKVPIPRCSRCEAVHRWKHKILKIQMLVWFFLTIALVVLLFPLFLGNPTMEEDDLLGMILVLTLIVVGASFSITALIFRLIKKKKYPNELFGKAKIKSNEGKLLSKHPEINKYQIAKFNIILPKY
jgi:hypothetical protein